MVSLSKVQADVERQAFRKTEMALSVIRKAVERIDENSASRCLSTRFNYLLLKSENFTTFRHVSYLAKLAWQAPPLVCSTGSQKRKLYKQIMENQGIEDPEVKYEAKII